LLLPLVQIIQLLLALVVLVKQEALVLFFLALKQLAVAMVVIGVMQAFLVALVVAQVIVLQELFLAVLVHRVKALLVAMQYIPVLETQVAVAEVALVLLVEIQQQL
jgi:hypothetical protein